MRFDFEVRENTLAASIAIVRRLLAVVAMSIIPVIAFAQATPDQQAALREITAFTNYQAKTDPHYPEIEAELMKRLDKLLQTKPATEWAPTLKRWYFGLSEKANADEHARIRAEEISATMGDSAPAQRYDDRMEALWKDLEAGKIGPREHALHALEAAMILFPQDTLLISLRETKVSLATDYELGNITRTQYDAAWAKARVSYVQNADSRQQALLGEMRAEQAAAARQAGPSLGDRFRQQRGITCTSTPGPLGISTVCR